MENAAVASRPPWLTDADELPHEIDGAPDGWAENYLSYLWAPEAGIGIYVHLSRRSDPFPLWDEQVAVALPGDRYLTSKAFSVGSEDQGPSVAGISFRCDEPYARWTKRFRGAARLLDGAAYRSAPVSDGAHVFVEWELEYQPLSPPFDFGHEPLDQAWASRHYEQHHHVRGWLTVGDGERYELVGTGLRDHSWGVRDYREIGTTTWLHAQFPESGRHLMVVNVSSPSRPPFVLGVTGDGATTGPIAPVDVPLAGSLEEATADYRLTFDRDGERQVVEAEILNPLHAGFPGPAEIGLGRFAPEQASHHYIDAFTRFRWDGEVGFGITERTVDLQSKS